MATLLPLLVVLLPLLITPGILFRYDITPKILTLVFGVAACLALPREVAPGVAALWSRRSGRWLCVLAAAQVAWFTVATAFSSRPWFSILGGNWRRMGLVTVAGLVIFSVLAAGYLCRRPDESGRVLRAFAVATILASVYGIAQYFDIDPLQSPAGYHAQAGDSTIVRPPGTLGHADYFGWWLAVAIFCAAGLARIEKGVWRWVGRAACVLAGAAIVLSGTRAAMLGVAVGFVCLFALAGFRPGKRHWLAALAFAGILLVFYVSPGGTRLRARVRWSGDEPVGGARPLLWRDTLRMAAARPLLGFGPETFDAAFPQYQSAELSRLLPDFYYESPHNTALDALTGQGIPGLAIALGWAALGGFAVMKTRRVRPELAPALAAALAASCVASMFGAVTAGPVFATLLVIAMLVALDTESAGSAITVRPVVALAASVPVVLCLAVFGAVITIADWKLARFQKESDTTNAIGLYRNMERSALPGPGDDLYCARRLASLPGPDSAARTAAARTAFDAARRAIESADSPANAWYNLAMFSAAQNDSAGAEKALRAAITLAPQWFKPHWALANVLGFAGRRSQAEVEARQALWLNGGKDAEVRQTVEKLTNPAR